MKSFIVGRVKKRFNETRAYATFKRRTQLGSWEIEWYKLRRMKEEEEVSWFSACSMYVIHVFAQLNEKAGETL